MMLKQKLRLVAATCLIWIVCLSSCNALLIKTWFLDSREQGELIRKNSSGTVSEHLSYVDAYGYRCYSPTDDEAWRNRLAVCCAKAK